MNNPYQPPNPPYMPPQQPPPPMQQGFPHPVIPTADDDAHLNTLAICHFIYAGLIAIGGLIGILYVVLGIVMAAEVGKAGAGGGGPPPAAIGGIMAAIGGFITLFFWALAACVVYSGFNLRKRQKRTFSFVIACLCCMNIPLGTTLGVFTMVVLSRQSVKAIYDRVAYYGS